MCIRDSGSGAGIIPVTSFDATSYYSTLKFMQGTNWHYSRNRSGSTRYSSVCVWPFVSSYENYQIDGGDIVRQSLRENLDGSYPVFPLIICSDTPNKHILGELQGCYATTGYGGISAEDTFTINGDTYIIFPCVPNADRGDFMCIKKE